MVYILINFDFEIIEVFLYSSLEQLSEVYNFSTLDDLNSFLSDYGYFFSSVDGSFSNLILDVSNILSPSAILCVKGSIVNVFEGSNQLDFFDVSFNPDSLG